MDLQLFCGDEPFFDYSRDFNTTNPTLSECFQRTILDLSPCAFLIGFGIPYLLVIRKSYNSCIPVSKLFLAKLVITSILWLLTWVDFGRGLWDWVHKLDMPMVDLVSPLLLGLGMAIAAFILNYDRLKGVRTSSLLSCYWILYLVLWALVFKGQVELLIGDQPLKDRQKWRSATFFISYALVIAQFVMCFYMDKVPTLPANDPFAEVSGMTMSEQQSEESIKKIKPLPEVSASFLSKIIFEWFTSMIVLGYKRPIVDGDLWELDRADKAGRIARHFLHIWGREKERYKKINLQHETAANHTRFDTSDLDVLIEQPSNKKKKSGPSLFKAMVKAFGPPLLYSNFLKLLNDSLTFVGPQLLSALIAFISSDAPVWQGYSLAVLLFVSAILRSVIFQNHFHISFRVGMRVRSAIVALVYRKSLLLSNAARKESTIGEIANLMSVDAQRIMDLVPYLYGIWSAPFTISLSMYFIWQLLGPSALAGLGVMIILMPINAIIANFAYKFQNAQMKLKDERIKLMNEILNGVKVLKMYAWEMSFKGKVEEIRSKELKILRNFAILNALISFTWTCAPFLVSLVTFAVYVLSDSSHVLDAQKVFVSISLFNILQFPLIMLPFIISALVQAKVSMNRLQKFVTAEEIDTNSVDRLPGPGPAISVHNATLTWEKGEEPTLRDINMEIPKGSLVAIVGQVGSGKSSLLSSLLGNMEKVEGHVCVKGSVAYVAQQAWIQNLTVRDNILFGKPIDECKYQNTVEACDLKEDFEMLPAGGLTEIGERGINLSGGQKQRVSIARAVYHDSEIYLLDDPLSAVDAHVGKHIFDNVIGPNGCLKSKTRVLVTHSVAFLPQVDNIFVFVNGRISEVGNYNELLEKNGDFADFLKNYGNEDREDNGSSHGETEDSQSEAAPEDAIVGSPVFGSMHSDSDVARPYKRTNSRKSESEPFSISSDKKVRSRKKSERRRDCKVPEKEEKKKAVENKLMTEETAEIGNIKLSIVILYMRSIGFVASTITITGYVLQNAATVYSNIWLSQWTGDPIVNGTQPNTNYRLTIFGVLGFANAFFVLVTTFVFSIGALFASRVLHVKMLDNILKAPMSFFDTTPLGRIVNRFSKDIYLIDEVVPESVMSFMEMMFMGLSTIFVIIYSTPIFGAVIVPIAIMYYFIQRFYIRTSRQLKRLESISRSPIYSHFSETLAGVNTIRAYRLQNSFIKQSEEKVDTNQKAYFPNVTSNRWLGIRMELVGNLIVLFAAVFAVVERQRGSIVAGLVGLSISYAMEVTSILNWLVRSASEAETNIVAVERVEEYANVEQEAPLYNDDYQPPTTWPVAGEIQFQNYSTKYREELDLVVKNINVHIKGGEKVGVVGRTGAGKSSLTLALFRIIESVEGKIKIDGLDISKMGLHSLRSKISIIPQDPVLFSGTLRMNLDPFETYSDDALWDALEHSHLKDFVSGLAKKLEHDVAEGGDNLSVGQRQLVCLARALLRNSKILVLDEATAAIDLETDDLIQRTIREEFANCTTFTIAHRLNTIMDSTRILVMDAGRISEYDTPANLLESKGIFYSMAKDAGLTN